MEETGLVVKIEGDRAYVSVDRKSACEACPAGSVCKTTDEGAIIEAINEAKANIGDRVRVSFKAFSYLKGSIIVYGIPALCLIAGAIIGKELLKNLSGLDPELLSAIGGLGAFGISFIIIKLLSKRMEKKKEYIPVVESILD
ncbi:MAG: SoxR reducing system RseC family protein [Thermodesulfovibrionales bacterium]|nr:SoxR reducing system RseC family protein [Thermodesulfovibrionales bacterium]